MRIVTAFPPNYRDLNRRFNIRGKPVIFSYGDTIYNPSKIKVTPCLMAHEQAHGARQIAAGVQEWWRDYLADDQFRFDEELIGHRAEWQTFRETAAKVRDDALDYIAQRLSGPLYGNMVSYDRAVTLITQN